jgi:hypothetical protein
MDAAAAQSLLSGRRFRSSGTQIAVVTTMEVLNIADMTRIAVDAAHEQSEALEVIGVTLSAGGGDYVEVLLSVHGCRLPPCQMSLGVFRNMPEAEIRAELAKKLSRHLEEHHPE